MTSLNPSTTLDSFNGKSLWDKGKLPNLRDLIIPDTAASIIDMDLARADMQIVAWEANAIRLKELLREEKKEIDLAWAEGRLPDKSKDAHSNNALAIFGKTDKKHRDLGKKIGHAANYLVSPKRCAQDAGILVVEAERFIQKWFFLNPEISIWHNKILKQITETRLVWNIFGFRRFFFGRVEEYLPDAVAWIPQSTIGILINKILCEIEEKVEDVEILLQVHDSLVMQTPTARLGERLERIRSVAQISLPFADPLTIPVGFKTSSVSWGQVNDYTPN